MTPDLPRPTQNSDLPGVAVFGAGGYAGMLLARLLARHPQVRLALLASERLSFTERAGLGDGWLEDIPVLGDRAAVPGCRDLGVQVALLATPVEVSLTLMPELLAASVRVIDLSGAFRLKDAALFERAYGLRHTAKEALAEARYVLPEVTGQDELPHARLVANPGCHVTAALLALAPLMRHGLLPPGAPLFIDGKSGASGVGRRGSPTLVELSLAELEGDLRPYRIGHEQHSAEISSVLRHIGERPELPQHDVEVVFVPHLVGTRRGLLVTCHGQLSRGISAEEAQEALRRDYAHKDRVHVVSPDEVSLRRPVGTPDAWVGLHAVESSATFCAVASLDNMLKGEASQAVQNLNGMLGLPDGIGLDSLWSAA